MRFHCALPPKPEPPAEILGPLLAAIESFDSNRAGFELSRLAAVLIPRDVVDRVAVPLLHEVGARWHDGKLAIAQEHLVSQLLRNLLGNMVGLFRTSNSAKKMVLATPAGESHEFGIPESSELWVGGAGSAELDLSRLGRKTIALKDLLELEDECQSWIRR